MIVSIRVMTMIVIVIMNTDEMEINTTRFD